MALRTKILGTACALALGSFVASPALADASNFSAVVNADYAHTSGDGIQDNSWNFSGIGAFDTDILWNMSFQGQLGYTSTSFRFDGDEGIHGSDLYYNLSPFWRTDWGRVGAVFGVNAHDYYSEYSPHTMNYGGYAEWYAMPQLTLAIKAGGWTTDYYESFNSSDAYVGGEAIWYVIPDVALTGTIDYTAYPKDSFESDGRSFSETDYGLKAEWLVSETTPVSVYGSWVNSHLDHESINTWSLGVKLYLNQGDATTLVDRQRSGSSEWNTSFRPVADSVL